MTTRSLPIPHIGKHRKELEIESCLLKRINENLYTEDDHDNEWQWSTDQHNDEDRYIFKMDEDYLQCKCIAIRHEYPFDTCVTCKGV
ncbi:hypothetical protein QKU48_gp0080 [Fadolivirus algeromassiliense]|jgi:hypothetical protein|uniref:Uncharacterized protein n=1 Tax=Fadolivirus FV1/VV64 TaxID=3070911 RepID=A0A7D3R142_9VIRU|nr:hypothetical protein QKU48_gp0080 [Fadolivirus algeromassiliense]QKF93538.1 hypothetical protein Fadolivirus_1_80 [Fadolivirus FV1/VV64]